MINVTRLGGDACIVNAGLIETVEATPDTVITLATGKKIMVRESVEEVVQRATAYFGRVGHATGLLARELHSANNEHEPYS